MCPSKVCHKLKKEKATKIYDIIKNDPNNCLDWECITLFYASLHCVHHFFSNPPISKHPRDNGEFPDFPIILSNAFKIQEQIESSSLVISRYSSIIYEALLMGRPVIYYNPHNEKMRTFNEDDIGGIFKVYKKSELKRTIENALATYKENEITRRDFLTIHCGPLDHNNTKRCQVALNNIANWPYSFSPIRWILYTPTINYFNNIFKYKFPPSIHKIVTSLFGDN